MFDSCIACGAFADTPNLQFKRDNDAFVCNQCGHKRTLVLSDLFLVFGPSGAGKTSLWNHILTRPDRPDLIYLNSDILWSLHNHMGNYVDYWLYISANIAQCDHPVVLHAGFNPADLEKSRLRDLFRKIHSIALSCSDEELERRLLSRPPSRASSKPPFITKMKMWNQTIRERATSSTEEAYEMLDTTGKSLDQTCSEFIQWLNQKLV